MSSNGVISWNSVPDYDNWGWDDYWDYRDWMTWFYQLKEHFGQQKAKYIWEYAWFKQTNLSSPISARTFSSDFRTFVKENNLEVYSDGLLENLLVKPSGTVIGGINEVIEGVAGGVGITAKALKYIIPVAGITAATVIAFRLIKKYKKT